MDSVEYINGVETDESYRKRLRECEGSHSLPPAIDIGEASFKQLDVIGEILNCERKRK
jgi:hypothetical protein